MNPHSNSLPKDILGWSDSEKVDYFDTKIIPHPAIQMAKDQLSDIIAFGNAAKIVFVIGATGAGKTTLRAKLVDDLNRQAAENPQHFTGRIPVAGIDLDAQDSGNMSWKDDYYIPALRALNEPLIDRKIDYVNTVVKYDEFGNPIIRRETRKADLRHTLTSTLKHRKPDAFWVDSAQHLTKISGGRRLIDQIDSIKSLTDLSGVRHVLFGTHDLMTLLNLSPELARRTVCIHLRRYRKEILEDWEDFVDVLFNFEECLPVQNRPDLLSHADYFYEQSHGCVGKLKDMLTSSLGKALKSGAHTLTPEHWRTFEQQRGLLATNLSRIEEGERYLNGELGFGQVNIRARTENTPANGSNTKRRPGQRKPKRDQVGTIPPR